MGSLPQQKLHKDACVLSLLKSCAEQKDLEKGFTIHDNILRSARFGKDVFIDTALISVYAKCGALKEAKDVFNRIEARNLASWNALIGGYAQYGHANEALQCFRQILVENVFPDSITFVCTLKACGSARTLFKKGKEIHLQVLNEGLLSENILLANALVDMYCKCGSLAEAHEVFDDVRDRNVVTWNSMIAGYVHQERGVEASECYRRMECESLSPNAITSVCIFKSYGSLRYIKKGIELHAKIVSEKSLEENVLVCTSLLDMYARCGALLRAQQVFDCLSFHGIVTWTALIGGYAENGCGDEAFKWFEQMQHEGVLPNVVAYICILKACCRIGALEKGKRIHAKVFMFNLHEEHNMLGTTLVDMYIKCGALEKSQQVFDELEEHNAVTC
jgi:pentatricopeptide repeat domain-containing protein 1